MALSKDDDLLYLFTGTSEIFIKNRINRILQSYNKLNYTVIRYDMENTSISTVLNDAITVPLLEDLKVIIIKNPTFLGKTKEDNSKEYKEFIKYLKKPCEYTVLMIDANNFKINQANEIYKVLKNQALIINYDETQEIELKGWIIRNFATNNIEIREEALNLFMEYLNNNQVRMEQEIDKLISYVGRGGIVTVKDIKHIVPKDLSNEIFNLIKAIVDHNHIQISNIYKELTSNTKDVMGILGMISSTFVDMITITKLMKIGHSQNDIARFFNVSPGRAYYMIKNAKSFKLADLENYVLKLANLDYKIKSGQIDKSIGLDLLIIQL